MKISIVTVSFNQRPYLQEAIESVLSQHYPDLEYIVVDPGSTDGSRELIESYRSRLAHVIFDPDRGAADGLNKGFQKATGEIYGFLNADDVLFPDALQSVAAFFSANQEYGLVFGNGYKIDGQGNRLRHFKARSFTPQRYLCGGTQWLQQATFFRRELFLLAGGFNVENRTCWDGELFVTMAHQGARIGYLDADLGGFRIYEDSISGSGRLTALYRQDCRRIFQQVQGRDWSARDHIRKMAYRAESLWIRLGSLWQDRQKGLK